MQSPVQACDSAHFGWRIKNLLTSNSHGPVYIDLPSHATSTFSRTRPRSPSRSFLQYLSSAGSASKQTDEADDVTKALQKRDVRSAAAKVERLRLFKSEAEVKAMRRAADISADAHSKVRCPADAASRALKAPGNGDATDIVCVPLQVMRYAQPGQLESQLVAHFEYHTSLRGATRPAYVPVCSSGAQALTIHYVENNRPIKQGEMVLIDAGCEWGGYASDITRESAQTGHVGRLPEMPRARELDRLTDTLSFRQALSPSAALSPPLRNTCTKRSCASKRPASNGVRKGPT